MDKGEYYDRLDATADTPSQLFEQFETRTIDGLTYLSLSDARHGVERATVIVEDADVVVRGYPTLPRLFVLEPGITASFDEGDPVVVEEKLNGANVRIADVDGPLAFTRSGYVCPYTTSRAQELLELSEFFSDHPEKMLCAEFIGPETPYTAHDYEDVDGNELRVFGIRDRESGEPLPVAERRELCENYTFPQPSLFGPYERTKARTAIREIITDFDAEGREGVVLKTSDGVPRVKYTTRSQHHNDLAYAFSLPFDYGRDFVFSRIVRDAFQATEFHEDDDELRERAQGLGESILLPLVETIQDVAEDQTVGERHTVRGGPESVAALLDHLRDQSVKIEIARDYRENGQRVVEFVKVAESTRDRIQYYLEGGTYDA